MVTTAHIILFLEKNDALHVGDYRPLALCIALQKSSPNFLQADWHHTSVALCQTTKVPSYKSIASKTIFYLSRTQSVAYNMRKTSS